MEEEWFCFLQEWKFSSRLLTNLRPNLIVKEAQKRIALFFILLLGLKLTITILLKLRHIYIWINTTEWHFNEKYWLQKGINSPTWPLSFILHWWRVGCLENKTEDPLKMKTH